MKQKIIAFFLVFAMMLALAACGAGKETTLTGMVVSVNGTVVSLMEMDSDMSGMEFEEGKMPEGMEDFQGFGGFGGENFDWESFEGTFPGGGGFSGWGGEMPDMPNMPEGATMPSMPEGGAMPNFGGGSGMFPGFGSGGEAEFDYEDYAADMQTQDIDIGDAHISVEIDGGKATGSMDDLIPGAFVTVTVNGKGKVTNVLVSSQSGFGGGWRGGK